MILFCSKCSNFMSYIDIVKNGGQKDGCRFPLIRGRYLPFLTYIFPASFFLRRHTWLTSIESMIYRIYPMRSTETPSGASSSWRHVLARIVWSGAGRQMTSGSARDTGTGGMCSTTSSGDSDGKGLGEGFLQQPSMGEVQSCLSLRASVLRAMSRSWSARPC